MIPLCFQFQPLPIYLPDCHYNVNLTISFPCFKFFSGSPLSLGFVQNLMQPSSAATIHFCLLPEIHTHTQTLSLPLNTLTTEHSWCFPVFILWFGNSFVSYDFFFHFNTFSHLGNTHSSFNILLRLHSFCKVRLDHSIWPINHVLSL